MTHEFAFNLGDIVNLKSGGPDMTVEALTQPMTGSIHADNNLIWCKWFIDGHVMSERFYECMLRKKGKE